MKLYLFVTILLFSVVSFSPQVWADSLKGQTQEQRDELELEALYGVDVERDRLERGSIDSSTRDRYGDGRVGVFQDNTKNARNLDTNDSIGVEVKLFEFGNKKPK